MDIKEIAKSTSNFPFKQVKGKRGIKFRQECKDSDGTGTVLVIEHNGHDHLKLDFRSLYKRDSGKIGNKRIMHWLLGTKEAVQLASLLMYLADEHMRDCAENPYTEIVTHKEKAGFGGNWIKEDFESAVARTENRKSRSHLFGLMKRCIETCEDDGFIQFMLFNLTLWAEGAGDGFAIQQAEKAIAQLGLLPDEIIN